MLITPVSGNYHPNDAEAERNPDPTLQRSDSSRAGAPGASTGRLRAK